MKIDAITVCVDYGKYLGQISSNKNCFDSWTIVTTQEDEETIKICKQYGLDYVFTERLYEGGPFCKGKAINDGLIQIEPKDWIVHLDADTYLFTEEFNKIVNQGGFNKNCLYGLKGRIQATNEAIDDVLQDPQLYTKGDEYSLAGFFQMWHSDIRTFYSEESTSAGLDDILMRDSFSEKNWRYLDTYAVHFGPRWINHKGMVARGN